MKKKLAWLLIVAALAFVQVSLREYFDFYAGDIFVSFLIGGYTGMFAWALVRELD